MSQSLCPLTNPFPDTHFLAQFAPNTITYEGIPPFRNTEPWIELNTLTIYYIHNKQTTYTSHEQLISFQQLLNAFNIPHAHLQLIPPTPPNIPINTHKTWTSLMPPPRPLHTQTAVPFLDYHTNLASKFLPLFSYYIDSLFTPSKEESNGTWRHERAGNSIHNLVKGITISQCLPNLQNILCAKLLAIHHTLHIITHKFLDEPAYIFTNNLTSLYLLIK